MLRELVFFLWVGLFCVKDDVERNYGGGALSVMLMKHEG